MYERHKRLIVIIFIAVLIAAIILNADYSKIAEASISVMSIAVAVYISSTSVILGSTYAEKLKGQVDSKITTSTSLGVLAAYLRNAGALAVIMIMISTLYVLKIGTPKPIAILLTNNGWHTIGTLILRVVSAISCGLFAVNIVFMYLILLFLINYMSKSVK